MPYLFKTPTVAYGPIGPHRLWSFYKLDRGLTVIKNNGQYVETEVPSDEDLELADLYYLGGHEYTVDDEEAADLTDAGYGSYLTEL